MSKIGVVLLIWRRELGGTLHKALRRRAERSRLKCQAGFFKCRCSWWALGDDFGANRGFTIGSHFPGLRYSLK